MRIVLLAAAMTMLALCASCTTSEQSEQPTSGNLIPLNLDFSLPSLVDEGIPWGWSSQALAVVGVEAQAEGAWLRLSRDGDGSDGQVVYNLNTEFAGRRVGLAATVRPGEASSALVRIGVRVLDDEWQLTDSFSEWAGSGDLEAVAKVPENSYNVQLVAEYRGQGAVRLGGLQLSVDGDVAGSVLPGQSAPDGEVLALVRDRSIALASTDPDAPLEDLEGLRALIGHAPLILVGESTHGSSEIFELKARVVRWLALQGEPIVLVIEDHAGPAERIDRFIRTGEGDAASAVKGLFGFWARQEVVDMVRWMREATAAGDIQLSFAGVDLQVPLLALDRLEAHALEAGLDRRAAEALRPMRAAWEEQRYPRRELDELERWSSAALELGEALHVAGASERALYDARLVWQSAKVSGSNDIRVRDRFMADNFIWLREHSPPGTRFVFWSHNTHVRLDEDAAGQHLAAHYPGEVVSIGLFMDRGSTIAFDGSRLRSYELFPGPPGSIEELLHLTGEPVLALDLRPLRGSVLDQPLLHRNIGLWPADLGFYRTRIPQGFDALLWVDETTATRPIVDSGAGR